MKEVIDHNVLFFIEEKCPIKVEPAGCYNDKRSDRAMPIEVNVYLMGPYNAGPKSALFLRVAEIRAGVKRAGVKRAVFWLTNSKKRR